MIIPDYLSELEKYREEQALSVRDMAALIGISKTAYYDWLNGKAPIIKNGKIYETAYKLLQYNKTKSKISPQDYRKQSLLKLMKKLRSS